METENDCYSRKSVSSPADNDVQMLSYKDNSNCIVDNTMMSISPHTELTKDASKLFTEPPMIGGETLANCVRQTDSSLKSSGTLDHICSSSSMQLTKPSLQRPMPVYGHLMTTDQTTTQIQSLFTPCDKTSTSQAKIGDSKQILTTSTASLVASKNVPFSKTASNFCMESLSSSNDRPFQKMDDDDDEYDSRSTVTTAHIYSHPYSDIESPPERRINEKSSNHYSKISQKTDTNNKSTDTTQLLTVASRRLYDLVSHSEEPYYYPYPPITNSHSSCHSSSSVLAHPAPLRATTTSSMSLSSQSSTQQLPVTTAAPSLVIASSEDATTVRSATTPVVFLCRPQESRLILRLSDNLIRTYQIINEMYYNKKRRHTITGKTSDVTTSSSDDNISQHDQHQKQPCSCTCNCESSNPDYSIINPNQSLPVTTSNNNQPPDEHTPPPLPPHNSHHHHHHHQTPSKPCHHNHQTSQHYYNITKKQKCTSDPSTVSHKLHNHHYHQYQPHHHHHHHHSNTQTCSHNHHYHQYEPKTNNNNINAPSTEITTSSTTQNTISNSTGGVAPDPQELLDALMAIKRRHQQQKNTQHGHHHSHHHGHNHYKHSKESTYRQGESGTKCSHCNCSSDNSSSNASLPSGGSTKDHLVKPGEVWMNRYSMDLLIGTGSFGQVVRANDLITGEPVAIKIIRNRRSFVQQAETEIRLLRTLSKYQEDQDNMTIQHWGANCIVRLKSHFMYRGHLCLVFELLTYSLYDVLRKTGFSGVSLGLTRKFGIQLCSALHFLAQPALQIIHCDLKPENVLLVHPGRSAIKLVDFGSSCRINERLYVYIQSRFYRAPEVLLYLPYSTAIDMWSLGCVLVELHTGQPLFVGQYEHEQMLRIIEVCGMPPERMILNSKRTNKYFMDASGDMEVNDCMGMESDYETTSSINEKIAVSPIVKSQFKPKVFRNRDGKRIPFEGVGSRKLCDILGANTGGPGGRRKDEQGHTPQDYDRFIDLVSRMLTIDPANRITPDEALKHPFFSCNLSSQQSNSNSDVSSK